MYNVYTHYTPFRNADDAVYTKLLNVAARTMPQKPTVTLPTVPPKTHSLPPSYTPYPDQETKYLPLHNFPDLIAPPQSYFRETSYAQLYHTALYHSTQRYVPEDAAQPHYQQVVDRHHTPYIPNYATPGYVQVNGFKKEKVDYSFTHYAPY